MRENDLTRSATAMMRLPKTQQDLQKRRIRKGALFYLSESACVKMFARGVRAFALDVKPRIA